MSERWTVCCSLFMFIAATFPTCTLARNSIDESRCRSIIGPATKTTWCSRCRPARRGDFAAGCATRTVSSRRDSAPSRLARNRERGHGQHRRVSPPVIFAELTPISCFIAGIAVVPSSAGSAMSDVQAYHDIKTNVVLYGALFANLRIALAKFVAAAISGSSSMLAAIRRSKDPAFGTNQQQPPAQFRKIRNLN
jgi:hypothetical protein